MARTHHPTRRRFLRNSAYAGFTIACASGVARTYAANEKLRFANIGIGGRAGAGVGPALKEHMVACADVDPKGRAGKALKNIKDKSPDTKFYTDYRKLFDEHKDLDAVWVGTPDHHHFPASIRALEAGAGVYCEKPLTWSIWEARKLREVAEAKGVPTQMGNQGHSSEGIRLIVEYIRGGYLGKVTHVDAVCSRGFSAKGRPDKQPVPDGMDWEAWLGAAPYRDYHKGPHPFSWRGYRDFGTGSLGDMACHTIDGPVWGLKLYEVDAFDVDVEMGEPTEEGWPPKGKITYKFPARGDMPPVTLTWIHGGLKIPRPPQFPADRKLPNQGCFTYGDKGVLMSPSHCTSARLVPESYQQEVGKPKKLIERVPGHTGDFLRACKDRSAPKPSSNFGYAARLTEIVLAGNLAWLAGENITYNMTTGKTNSDKANRYLNRNPRKGWEFGYEGSA